MYSEVYELHFIKGHSEDKRKLLGSISSNDPRHEYTMQNSTPMLYNANNDPVNKKNGVPAKNVLNLLKLKKAEINDINDV